MKCKASLPHMRIAVAFALAGVIAATRCAAQQVNFDNQKPGEPAVGWTTAVTGTGESKWTIEPDPTAPSPPMVLKQSGWTPNPSFPLCLKTAPLLRNGFVEVKFKPISGTNDQAAGVVWRARDAKNYYIARANALENNVVLYKVENGKRKALDIVGRTGGYGIKATVPRDQWGALRVTFAGSQFRVFLNGAELFAVEDSTFPDAGMVGLWTKADSVTLFDDFRYGDQPL